MNSISLSQLVFNIKETINKSFDTPIWVVAEISEMNINYSGHCYLELVEKQENTDNLLAKSRATIWARSFRIIQSYFKTVTRESLREGIKVLIKVTVEFHEFYGFSLNVVDIDPKYTVGELALKRAMIIERLTNDGVLEMNKTIKIPLVPQRIAVITSATAAGYGDFNKQLTENNEGLSVYTKLFQAVMQGNDAPKSIIKALSKVSDEVEKFDVVVIIRGGGSKIDLSCFDDYDLAYFITQFPLPIITGIGHERDHSVADLVANTSMKTPTAVADLLIDMLNYFYERLVEADLQLKDTVSNYTSALNKKEKHLTKELFLYVNNKFEQQFAKLNYNEQKLNVGVKQLLVGKQDGVKTLKENMYKLTNTMIKQNCYKLDIINKNLKKYTVKYLQNQTQKTDYLQSNLKLIDPKNILKRGFSIVKSEGKLITNAKQVKKGDELEIDLAKGTIKGKVL